ncbi:MAG: hypothetical protein ACRC75_06580, partial [Olsenella sp.]
GNNWHEDEPMVSEKKPKVMASSIRPPDMMLQISVMLTSSGNGHPESNKTSSLGPVKMAIAQLRPTLKYACTAA